MRYKLNAVITYGNPLSRGVKAHRIEIDLPHHTIGERMKITRSVARKLEKTFDGIAGVTQEKGKMVIYLVSKKRPEVAEVEVSSRGIILKVPLKYRGESIVSVEKLGVLNELLRRCIEKRILEKGFIKSFTQRKYYGGAPKFFVVGEFQEPVYVYDGFRIKTRVFKDGSAIVYLEPKSVWRISLLEYVKHLLSRGIPIKEIRDFIIEGRPKRKAKVAPYGLSGLIIDISLEKSVNEEMVNGETLRNYWLKKYGIRLPDDDFVVYVDIDRNPMKYPASQVFLSTKEMPFTDKQRRVFILPPKRKKRRTLQILRELLEEPLELGNVTIAFDVRELVSLDQLKEKGKIKEYGCFKLPKLRFFNNGLGDKPLDIVNHGPYSGPLNVNIVYVVPLSSEHIVKHLHNALQRAYENLKLGSLKNSGIVKIEGKLTRIAYRRIAEIVSEVLNKIPEPKICLVLLPKRGEHKFEFIKGAKERGVRDRFYQFMRISTAKKIIEGKRGYAENTVSQIYVKAGPGKDKALWILLEPAGKIGNTIYAAYDVSRDVKREYDEITKRVIKEKREAAARAAICDCFGLTVRQRSKISPTGEILTGETIKDLVLGLEKDGREGLKRFGHSLKRFVLFKDGEIHTNEKLIAEKAIKEIKEELKDVKFELYSVIKGGIERVYADDGNPPPGFYVIFDDNSGLIISSDLSYQRDKVTGEERLLADPLLIRREVTIPSDNVPSIKQILHEFFDLTRLHWQSIIFKMKTCLPLKLVQEIGQYSRREIIIPEDISYLTI